MNLFKIENKRAIPSVHALLIEPFKTIWEEDITEQKEYAIKIFSYTELMCSMKKSNPFMGYGEDVRAEKVKKEIFGNEHYPTNEDMLTCVMKYKQLVEESSPTLPLLRTCEKTIDKLKNFLEDFDPDERTKSGGLVFKPADITKAINDIPNTLKNIKLLKEQVQYEQDDGSTTRKNKKIGLYEE